MRVDMRYVKRAIAGDALSGTLGLQDRMRALERDRGDRRLWRAMVAIATAVGAGIGAALSPFAGPKP